MRDSAAAALVGALAFAIYVSTLAPGLVDITDTPKFQFIGHVLGVSHNPGYPLYSVLTYAFGHLPIGSLAYRINLFSALCGALSCGAAYLLARSMGSTPIIAAGAVVAYACGATVWSVSTVAEVYTLHVLLVCGVLLALVRWRQTGRASHFYLAVALFAIGEGHHTDIVLILPAIAAYACTVAPRFALRGRTIAISAVICVIGLLQYGFIILRTRQGAFVESPAYNLTDLFNIVRGKQFAPLLLPVSVPMLLHDRLPLVGRIFVTELSIVAIALAAAGAIVLWRKRWRDALLLTLTVIAFASFGAVYGVADIADFMIPALLVCWIMAAVAVTSLAGWLAVRAGTPAAALVTIAFVLLPIYGYARNRTDNDLSHRWAPVRYMAALFQNLPERSAVLREDFLVDRMAYYKVLGEGTTRGRDILAPYPNDYARVADLWRRGYSVFAFSKSAMLLRLQGADFAYSPEDVHDGLVDRMIGDLPPGSLVALAVPAERFTAFAQANGKRLQRIGVSLPSSLVENAAIIGVVGRSGALQQQQQRNVAAVSVSRGTPIGSTGVRATSDISAQASQTSASIGVGPRELLRTGEAAVAVWDSQGRLLQAFALDQDDTRVPARPEALKVFRLRALRTWQQIPTHGIDITGGTSSGNVVLRLPAHSAIVLYLGRARPLAPGSFDENARQPFPFDVKEYNVDDAARARLGRDILTDGFAPDRRLLASPFVYRIAASPPIGVEWPLAFQLGCGGLPDVAWARTISGAPADYYAVDISSHLERIDRHTNRLHMARDHHEQLVGAGWSPVDTDDYGAFRRMVDREAELLIPAAPGSPIRLSAQAMPGSGAGWGNGAALELLVNGRAVGSQPFKAGWARYDWDVPADVMQSVNSVVLKAPAAGAAIADVLVITR